MNSEALRELLGGIIDYAGLFPPAALDMEPAVRNYAGYRASDHAWMLGAFVLPAARLDEFTQLASLHADEEGGTWPLSLLVPTPAAAAYELADAKLRGLPFEITAVECRSEDLEGDTSELPPQLDAFFELAPAAGLAGQLDLLAEAGRFAKLRTGSVRADEIPSIEQVLGFIDACAARRVPFKATAGLHHPLRSQHPLSYESDAPRATMHGFLNLFLTAALRVTTRIGAPDLERVLRNDPSAQPRLGDGEILVVEERLQAESIAAARRFARSFGSCSFEEPIDDLRSMGWL